MNKNENAKIKNILSFKKGTIFNGKTIKNWILYHTKNKTCYTKIAKKMIKYLNIKNEDFYYISKGIYQASSRNFQVCKKNN